MQDQEVTECVASDHQLMPLPNNQEATGIWPTGFVSVQCHREQESWWDRVTTRRKESISSPSKHSSETCQHLSKGERTYFVEITNTFSITDNYCPFTWERVGWFNFQRFNCIHYSYLQFMEVCVQILTLFLSQTLLMHASTLLCHSPTYTFTQACMCLSRC